MEPLKEIAAYCAAHIEDYEVRVQLALKQMDHMRCPFNMADDGRLSNEIEECAREWCDDHDVSIDFFDDIDVEEIVFAGA
jgi:hypothetical protein